MLKRIIIFSLLIFAFNVARAQSQNDFSGPFPKSATPPLVAEEHVHQKHFFTRHRFTPFKWKRTKVQHTAQYEFYKRIELAAKEHQRLLKKLYKPQYADFLYYGHKRKPKKHSPDKMRYCKQCGIRH